MTARARARVDAEGDRRRKSIGLSAKGRRLLLKLLPDIFAQMTALIAPLTKSERARLRSALLKIEAGLRRHQLTAP